jgi:hypothetical protein
MVQEKNIIQHILDTHTHTHTHTHTLLHIEYNNNYAKFLH